MVLIFSRAGALRLETAYDGLNFFKADISHINIAYCRQSKFQTPALRVSKSHKAVSIFSKPAFRASSGLKCFKANESKQPTVVSIFQSRHFALQVPTALSIFQEPALRASKPRLQSFQTLNTAYGALNFFF